MAFDFPPMKQFLALLIIAATVAVIFTMHERRVATAAAEAVALARSNAPRARPTPKPTTRGVAISRTLEEIHQELFSDLNRQRPADLVPQLEITRERILDKKADIEAPKGAIYDIGVKLVSAMIELAEERTKALEAVLQAAARESTLDGRNTTLTSSAFFVQTSAKRWDDTRRRHKPVVDQLYAQLRNSERDWNQRVGTSVAVDSYDVPDRSAVYITVDAASLPRNALERGAFDQRRIRFPWRNTYYDRYGYPPSR